METNMAALTLLEEGKSNVSIGVQTEQTIRPRRKLDLDNSISTPPSDLRKQIYNLMDELSETNEFHNLEIQVLHEENELQNQDLSTERKNMDFLQKSLRDAEQIILDANKEISNLKTINQDLNKKLEEESAKHDALITQYEDQVSMLHTNLKKKDLEIENLKKNKDDFDFKLELISENYNRKINELVLALEKKHEKESENEKQELIDELQRRLNEENDKTKELSKKLEELNLELLLNKEKVKLLEEQVTESSSKEEYSSSLRDISVQVDDVLQENGETVLKVSSSRKKLTEIRNDEVNCLVSESSNNLLLNNDKINGNSDQKQTEFVDVSVQTNDDWLNNSNREIEEIRCSFEKEIKELKDEQNSKLKSLECSNESLQQNNLSLTEKLNTANKVVEELKEKLFLSIVNVDALRRQLEEIKVSEIESVKETIINSSQNELSEKTLEIEELRIKMKELQSENDKLSDKISNLIEELKLAKEEAETLKGSHEKELNETKTEWELKVEGLKAEKETLNSIIADKDEKLHVLNAELNEVKNKLVESEHNFRTCVKDNETYIELLTFEKAELQNWIKAKEKEINDLNLLVENKLIKLETDSELKIEELKEMYEVEIKTLNNSNEALCEQIESIRNMYESEILKFVSLIEDQKIKNSLENSQTSVQEMINDSHERFTDDEENNTTLEACISKIKVERNSIVEMCNSKLWETSISITDNIKCESMSDASTIIQQPSTSDIMSLVPVLSKVEYPNETIGNYDLHTIDEESMQLKINSESAVIEFVNEFAKVMLRENVINPEELKTCTNVFYLLLNKYLVVLEIYSRLRAEFEEYKVVEQKERLDIVNRTVGYLDTLCSQLEVSGSSLNLSNSSFTPFHQGISSSTVVKDDYTEMEISVNSNVTMSNDPLALTQDMSFQTPLKTVPKSAKKANHFPLKTPLRSVSKPGKTPLKPEYIRKQMSSTPASIKSEKYLSEMQLIQLKNNIISKDKELIELKEMYNKKIRSSEEIMRETFKSFALLEERISKLEALSVELQTNREYLIKESADLRETLTKNLEEIANIKDTLIIEIISLNAQHEETFSDMSVTQLLSMFLNTIMESCKKMPEELAEKMVSEMKSLTEKNEMYESKILESGKEMDLLKEINAALLEEKEIIQKTSLDQKVEITTLKEEISELKGLKSKLKDLEERMIENDSILKTEIYLKTNTLKDLQKLKSIFEDVEKENSNLKQKIKQSDKIMNDLKTELVLVKKEQMSNEMKGDELVKEIEELKCILSDSETKKKDLQSVIVNFEEEVTTVKSQNKYKACQLELLNNKIIQAENLIQAREENIEELKQKIAALESKLESKSVEFSNVNEKYKTSQMEVEQLRQTVDNYKESVDQEIESLKNKLASADADLTSKLGIIQELSLQLEKAKENTLVQEEAITSLKERVAELEIEKQQLMTLKSQLEKHRETEKIMADEIEHLKGKVVASETDLIDKIEDVEKLSAELGKSKEIRIQNEETIAEMKQHLEELEDRIMKCISNHSSIIKRDEVTQTDFTHLEFDELSKTAKELRNTLSVVIRHVGLPEGTINGQMIIDQIDKMIADLKKEFFDRIDILRQDNQHLDDDNILLQNEMKVLVEQNNINKAKLNSLAKSEELLKAEVEVLKMEVRKLESKNKMNRNNNLCNRKLDKLEELHQSLVELMEKMLALTGMENVQKLNISTTRTFEIESKRIWDHFNGWVASKTVEVEELKSQLKELDEECESYAKVIVEDRKEACKVWEENRSEVKKFELQIVQLQEEIKVLKSEKEKLLDKLKILQNGGDAKDCLKMENDVKMTDELKSQNVALQSRIKDLEDSLSQARKQIEELDEECESYAKVIIEDRKEACKVWEENRSEVKKFELQIVQLQEEIKALKSEKEKLSDKVKILQNSGNTKDCLKMENDVKMIAELKKQNVALHSRIKDLEESLSQARKQIEELDEECESYAKTIKESQRDSLLYSEETQNEIKALKEQIEKMEKGKECLEEEKEALRGKIRLLESSNNQNNGLGSTDNVQSKRGEKQMKELKRTLALREMKILELEQLNEKNIIHKSQIDYLERSLDTFKAQLAQEGAKNRKLQKEVLELSNRGLKSEGSEDVDLLDQLRHRDSLGFAALHQIDDKEKLQKLEKDNRMLKEICRKRYNEIKRLETENQTLKGHERGTKNSNQMDSPIRTRCGNARFKKY